MSRRIEDRLSGAQIKKLCIEWERLHREGDARANGPRGEVYENDRAGRLTWAQEHLGDGVVVSFTLLSARQAAYLLDILAGKETRIDAKLREFARAAGILDLAGWFEALAGDPRGRARGLWRFGGRTLRELTWRQRVDLARLLSGRTGTSRRRKERTLFDALAAAGAASAATGRAHTGLVEIVR